MKYNRASTGNYGTYCICANVPNKHACRRIHIYTAKLGPGARVLKSSLSLVNADFFARNLYSRNALNIFAGLNIRV